MTTSRAEGEHDLMNLYCFRNASPCIVWNGLLVVAIGKIKFKDDVEISWPRFVYTNISYIFLFSPRSRANMTAMIILCYQSMYFHLSKYPSIFINTDWVKSSWLSLIWIQKHFLPRQATCAQKSHNYLLRCCGNIIKMAENCLQELTDVI